MNAEKATCFVGDIQANDSNVYAVGAMVQEAATHECKYTRMHVLVSVTINSRKISATCHTHIHITPVQIDVLVEGTSEQRLIQ